MENFSEEEILAGLKANPDTMYITPDAHKLYILVNNRMLCITTEEDLSQFDSANLNSYLQACLTELNK
jgi:hypothetical protein